MPNINIKLSDECHKKLKTNAAIQGETLIKYVNKVLNKVKKIKEEK